MCFIFVLFNVTSIVRSRFVPHLFCFFFLKKREKRKQKKMKKEKITSSDYGSCKMCVCLFFFFLNFKNRKSSFCEFCYPFLAKQKSFVLICFFFVFWFYTMGFESELLDRSNCANIRTTSPR